MPIPFPDNHARVARDFDDTARILCVNYATFLPVAITYREKTEFMELYINELPSLIDLVAMSREPGKRTAAQKLVDRKAYTEAADIPLRFRHFMQDTERNLINPLVKGSEEVILTAQLPLSLEDFEARVFMLPVNLENVSVMKNLSESYRTTIPAYIKQYNEVFGDLSRTSEKLPITFLEFDKKANIYHDKRSDLGTVKDIRLLTLQTFDKLRRRYSLDIVPKPPK